MSERTIEELKLELSAPQKNAEEMFLKKSEWGPGPWQDEPDRVEFEHLGFPCLLNRNMMHGNWCGYVAVPPGHPWHGIKNYDDVPADVHGGLTYAAPCDRDICHVPKPGEPDDVFWLGFDCGHYMDVAPGLNAMMEVTMPKSLRPSSWRDAGSYKTVAYVREQCEALAEQALAAAGGCATCGLAATEAIHQPGNDPARGAHAFARALLRLPPGKAATEGGAGNG